MSERADRTAWWGTCSIEECLTSMMIYPHPEAEDDMPHQMEWETRLLSIYCPVCGSSMMWGGTDHPADLLKNY